ncbi:MAG: RNA 2',3'-cyclic phosphodiesterase [Sphaerochaetaceae bacterium]|nr:RNA 2',3'-cyclic phosphodiesterase [Sphaerochaetaceae bacterium]MDD4008121.1 RNA 2',3'-cyclic phosphodiesterase [Sphaerochaetaceae bacterium]
MRLFIGIPVPDSTRSLMADEVEKIYQRCRGNYSEPELYHITIAFLGEKTASDVPLIRKAMQKAADATSCFDVALDSLGFFSSPSSATLWWGIKSNPELERLASGIREELSSSLIEFDDKPFWAHITLGRRIDLKRIMLRDIDVPKLSFKAQSAVLFESLRQDGQLVYRPLETIDF